MTPRDDGLARFEQMIRDAQRDDPRSAGGGSGRRGRPVSRGRRVAGGLVAVLVVLLIVGLSAGYIGISLTAPVAAAAATATSPGDSTPVATTVTMPTYGASAISVAGADDYLGGGASGILATGGTDKALPIASISKLITAMVILQQKPITSGAGPTITFSKDDHALYDKYYVQGATIAAMPTGLTMSEHDALATMLIVSACNYTEAVSTWAFGSQPAFIAAAQRWLRKNGLTHTRFVEATGLDARNTSTASDLISLGKLAKANPVIAEIAATPNLNVPGVPPMSGTNDLLGKDGVDGLKTGTLQVGLDVTSNLLFSATVDVPDAGKKLTVIGVVLGGATRAGVDDDVRVMLASLQAGFHTVKVGHAGQVVGAATTPWGGRTDLVLAADADIVTWSDTRATAKISAIALGAGRQGTKVGTVTWTAGPATTSVGVTLAETIRPPSDWWRLTHPGVVLPGFFGTGGVLGTGLFAKH